MLAASEAGDVFALLEEGARTSVDALTGVFAGVREPWLVRALLMYHARTGSARVVDLLARAPDLHARHLLDALLDQLRGERPQRRHALAALAPLAARAPAWLHRLPAHPLARELVRAARLEREPLPLLHALLALAALLPAAPALAAPHALDLAQALLRPAALRPPPPAPARAHLRLAQLALFHVLYATHPNTLLDALRADLAATPARDAWERDVAPLLASVRLHPALVTGSRHSEADAARWARLEPHDVLAECRRLSLPDAPPAPDAPSPSTVVAVVSASAATVGPVPAAAAPAPGSVAHASRAAGALRPGAEPWFPLGERCGADSAPQTPLPAEAECAEPPEAAVEATPENTPARETRAQFRFPAEGGAARAIGRRAETSPAAGDAYSARLSRVALERRAAESPVAFGGAPPAGAGLARPEPRAPTAAAGPPPPSAPSAPSALPAEDREVLELTSARWPAGAPRDPRSAPPAGGPPVSGRSPESGPPTVARRPSSCPPKPPTRSHSVAVQTVDLWPEPYEFLVADLYRCSPMEALKYIEEDGIAVSAAPSEKLETYISELMSGRLRPAPCDIVEQLSFMHAQLMHERWRREAHAERNRRLLGRCRQARALELQNQALRERARALQAERDELRARTPRAAPPLALAAAAAEREARLEAALAGERAARQRAEAALHEAEAARALHAAELRHARARTHLAATHRDALARVTRAADRRAACVRRLRRDLLVLGEREGRARAAPAPAPGGGEERALRAACARAEAECAAAAGRAESLAARLHEAEAALGARDGALAELRRLQRRRAGEADARLAAVQDKYAALMRVVRAAEARRLEWAAERELRAPVRFPRPPPRPARPAPAGSAAAHVPAPDECARLRRQLEERDRPSQ